MKVYSPIDSDQPLSHDNVSYLLKANATTELPIEVAAHAIRTLGHQGVLQYRHPNDIGKAEERHRMYLRMTLGRVKAVQGTVTGTAETAAEAARLQKQIEAKDESIKARETAAQPAPEKTARTKAEKKG